MTTCELKPGGNRAFGGGLIDRANRHSIDPSLIAALHSEIIQFTLAEKTSTEHYVEIGKIAINMKQLTKQGSFGPFLKMNYPFFSMRTIQRAMKVADFFNFDEYPCFLSVPRTHLYKISEIYTWEEALDILNDNCVNLRFTDSNVEQLRPFLADMKSMAKGDMGYMIPQEYDLSEDKDSSSQSGRNNEWTTSDYPVDATIYDEEVQTTVNTRELIPVKFLEFIKDIQEVQDTSGTLLELTEARKLLIIVKEALITIEKFSPPDLETKHIKNTTIALRRLVKRLDNSQS